MSMFWNPGTGTYQRCCPALSPVKSRPLKSGVKPNKQPRNGEPKQPLIQPLNVARDQPRKQPQDVAKKVNQPLKSGVQSQPPATSQPPKGGHDKFQPPFAAKSQPPDSRGHSQVVQPARMQPLNIGVRPQRKPPKEGGHVQNQPLVAEIISQFKVGRKQPLKQPPDVAQPQKAIQPPDALDPVPNKQPQSAAKSQVKQPPNVAQPPNTVQPQMPDLPPDPDPSKCKKVRMPITTGYTSYPQWGKAAPSLRIYKFYNLNETKVKG